MITKEQIRREIEFYEKLYRGYAGRLKLDPEKNLFFKHQHGKLRPYSWENGRERYLSMRKERREIAEMLEGKFLKECMEKISTQICVLREMEAKFLNFEELEPAYLAAAFEKEKGYGLRVEDFVRQTHFLKSFDDASKAWLENMGPQNPYRPEDKIHTTPGGIKVRSKSELVIGAFLDTKVLPHKYEELLIVEGNHWYPDFKVRRPRDGKIIIWEHFGMMDDEEYAERNQYKLMIYARNGYRMWDNMIVTYDEEGSFDMTVLERIYEMMLK